MRQNYTLKTEADTQKLAVELASELRGGAVIGLIGDLGAGKTTFTQYLAAAVGVKKPVTSPTFTIMQVYNAVSSRARSTALRAGFAERPRQSRTKQPRTNTITTFVHIDAYRLASADDLSVLGIEEYFTDPQTVTVIEWAERVEGLLPPGTLLLRFTQDGGKRTVTVKK